MDDFLRHKFGFIHPTLPYGLAQYKGFKRLAWIIKSLTLTNEAGDEVAKGIYYSVNADLVIDSDGRPFGDDRSAIQIVESLCEGVVSLEWMFFMRAWHIT
jgi:hypothetical protein